MGASACFAFWLVRHFSSSSKLAVPAPLIAAALAVTVLSLGYDMTQPLLAGIVTQLAPERPGQAMGLNVFCLFTGFGLGSLIFGLALRAGFPAAFVFFSSFQGGLALLALFLFSTEANANHMRLAPNPVARMRRT